MPPPPQRPPGEEEESRRNQLVEEANTEERKRRNKLALLRDRGIPNKFIPSIVAGTAIHNKAFEAAKYLYESENWACSQQRRSDPLQ
ncbi:MAG: hypothetical protein GY811_17030 [Myxococcales bacterium]|nr:hypothetical protein [Myxococcales bacterium]